VAVADEVVVHAPSTCGGCGASLIAAEVVQTETRQMFDLPPIRLLVVDHRAHGGRCSPTASALLCPRGPWQRRRLSALRV
jgi:transposase